MLGGGHGALFCLAWLGACLGRCWILDLLPVPVVGVDFVEWWIGVGFCDMSMFVDVDGLVESVVEPLAGPSKARRPLLSGLAGAPATHVESAATARLQELLDGQTVEFGQVVYFVLLSVADIRCGMSAQAKGVQGVSVARTNDSEHRSESGAATGGWR